eukprot:TRINITY_DN12526_c0_g1_i1.p1 TRINITY_DN12526_c0_g1~~TRINITY_DN12526_c0_g1_i1.p1  ORF type:complete len:294 (+),score=52.73 TRINITY_DN12526_c0_g1_i1:15-896(+)
MTNQLTQFPLKSLKFRQGGKLSIYSANIRVSYTPDQISFIEGEDNKTVLVFNWNALTALNIIYTPMQDVRLILEPSHRNPTLPEISYVIMTYDILYVRHFEEEISKRKLKYLLTEIIPDWMFQPVVEKFYKRQYREFVLWAMNAIQMVALFFFVFEGLSQIPKYLPKSPGSGPGFGEKVKGLGSSLLGNVDRIRHAVPTLFYLISGLFFLITLPFLWLFYILGFVAILISRWSVMFVLLSQSIFLAQQFKPFTAVVSSVFRLLSWVMKMLKGKKKEKKKLERVRERERGTPTH